MAVEVRWTLFAIEEIEKIAEYISQDSPTYPQLQVDNFLERVQILNSFPEVGRVVPGLKQDDIRELIEGSYRIIHRVVSKERIDVLTVHHAHRLLQGNPFS